MFNTLTNNTNDSYDISDFSILLPEIKYSIVPPAYILESTPSNILPPSHDHITSEISFNLEACFQLIALEISFIFSF